MNADQAPGVRTGGSAPKRLEEPTTAPRRRALAGLLMIAATIINLPKSTMAVEWRKLTDGASFSDVSSTYEITSDGQMVVFSQDQTVPSALEIFGVFVDGSAAQVGISGLLSPSSTISALRLSPDGGTVVYVANQDTPGVSELYSAPVGGGIPIKLSGTLVGGGNVLGNFRISPAGDRVVYVADQEVDEMFELFSVRIDGASWVKLSGTLGTDANIVADPQISPASDRVVYTAVQNVVAGPTQIYSVPISGGTAVKLNGTLVAGGSLLYGFAIDRNGDNVVYIADQEIDDRAELFSVPLAGGTAVKLNGTLVASGDVTRFKITPAGNRVVYMANQESFITVELYSVPIEGGSWVEVSHSLVDGGDVMPDFLVNSVGRVVYRAEHESDGFIDLFSNRSTGGTPSKLNGTLPAGADVIDFQLSPDGSWVVYRAGQNAPVVPQLFRAPVVGPSGADEQLSTLPVRDADHWRIDPRGDRVIAMSSLFDGILRPWRIWLLDPLDLLPTELVETSAFAVDGDVTSFLLGPDGAIVYRADQDTDEEFELYSIPGPLLFVDGFETGDTSAWSAVVP